MSSGFRGKLTIYPLDILPNPIKGPPSHPRNVAQTMIVARPKAGPFYSSQEIICRKRSPWSSEHTSRVAQSRIRMSIIPSLQFMIMSQTRHEMERVVASGRQVVPGNVLVESIPDAFCIVPLSPPFCKIPAGSKARSG